MKTCDEQERLVGYLYDEVDERERREFDAHLAGCAECCAELEALRSTRTYLTQWAPPAPDLGFRLIRGAEAPVPALPRRRWAPAFAMAAAATIVLAVASAIANIEVRYDGNGMTVRTGWNRAELTSAAAAPPAGEQAVPVSASAAASELERRLSELESRLGLQAAAAPAAGTPSTDADILRQVRQLITQSESRQRVALAQGLMQVINDVERDRRADLAMFQQGTYDHERLTNAELQQTRDMVNQFIRAATKQDQEKE